MMRFERENGRTYRNSNRSEMDRGENRSRQNRYSNYNDYDMDDSYILDEIERIKNETNEIKRVLSERSSQLDQVEATIDRCGVDSNELVKKIKTEIDKLQERIEEMEDAITDSVERNNRNIIDGVAAATKPIEDRSRKMKDEMNQEFDSIKKEILDSSMKVAEAKETVDSLNDKLADKAEKKAIVVLHNKLSTLFAIGVADFAGTVMVLILLCYLILSISR